MSLSNAEAAAKEKVVADVSRVLPQELTLSSGNSLLRAAATPLVGMPGYRRGTLRCLECPVSREWLSRR